MAQAEMTTSSSQVRVWDLGVRLFHWSLVSMVAAAYIFVDPRSVHLTLGYIVIGLIAFRLIWGLIGGKYARFSNFVPGPRRLLTYLRDMRKGREARYLGHNPAGAAMIILLLITLSAVGISGYMIGMDAYFGQTWVEDLHEVFVNFLIVLVIGHVGGVIFSSRRHHENLVKSMVTGKKETTIDEQNTRR